MKLILTKNFIPFNERKIITSNLNLSLIDQNLDGFSFFDLSEILKKEQTLNNDSVVFTSNETFLLFHPTFFDVSDIFVYEKGRLFKIQELSNKELRPAHNLMKMYIAGAFFNDIPLKKGCISTVSIEPGDSIIFGEEFCKNNNLTELINKKIKLVPESFTVDNTFYSTDVELMSIKFHSNEKNQTLQKINVHSLFGFKFENISDCIVIKGNEEDKIEYFSILEKNKKHT